MCIYIYTHKQIGLIEEETGTISTVSKKKEDKRKEGRKKKKAAEFHS